MVSNDDFDGKATHLSCFYLHINFEQKILQTGHSDLLRFFMNKSLHGICTRGIIRGGAKGALALPEFVGQSEKETFLTLT